MPSRPKNEFLHWIRDHTDEDSPFLYMVLGLIALANGTLEAADPPPGDGADVVRRERGEPLGEDLGLSIALGLVSLGRLLLATCDQAGGAPPGTAAFAVSPSRHSWRDVLI